MSHESTGTKSTGKIRKIVLDRDACIGARSCVIAASKTFEMDDENLALVKSDASNFDGDDVIMQAAEACPVLCIHLYGENDEKIFPN